MKVRMLARFWASATMSTTHNADTSDNGQPLYLRVLSQYNRWSSGELCSRGSLRLLPEGMELNRFRKEMCAAHFRRRTSL